MATLHSVILTRIQAFFDVPIMQNNLRGMYVEHLVAELLGEGWDLVGQDWAAWDIQHSDGTRVEVKQSARRQTWAAPENGSSKPSFSIRVPKFIWKGAAKTTTNVRPADIYVFAWHGTDGDESDQRVDGQWQFFVVPASELPAQNVIGLTSLKRLTEPTDSVGLRKTANNLRVGRLPA